MTMYGTDHTPAATLAATGVLAGTAWHIIAAGVLIMAALTLFTISSILRHRAAIAQQRGD